MPKHGMCNTPIYHRWEAMNQRCNNPNYTDYKHYGGRGIKICSEWIEFMPFYNWAILHGFSEDLELDREDSDKDYYPGNCRWVTKEINMKNVKPRYRKNNPGWGISLTDCGKYNVQVYQNGKLNYVGNFETHELAKTKRDQFVRGKFKPKGIRPDKGLYPKPWGIVVHVVKNKKCYHVGTYKTKEEALRERDKFAATLE